jgi:hypothetical protein
VEIHLSPSAMFNTHQRRILQNTFLDFLWRENYGNAYGIMDFSDFLWLDEYAGI